MATPFFSICIPNYNYENYIRRTIESVLMQSFRDFEVIVVDNASTDSSWEVILSFQNQDSRIRAYRNSYNVGFAPNLQRASQLATGRFIILLSSDDIMLAGALQTYADILLSQGDEARNTVLHSAFDQIDGADQYIKTVVREKGGMSSIFVNKATSVIDFRIEKQAPLDAVKFGIVSNKGIGAFLTICYPRELWCRVEGYDTQYYIFPDKAFLFKILLLEPQYLYVNKVLFGYRVHTNNQNAKNAGQAALKHQVDGYMRTINFLNSDLERLNLRRQDLAESYIRNLCVMHAYIAYSQNCRLKAFKILCFAYATYPTIAIRNVRLWGLKLLLISGSVGYYVINFLRRSNLFR